MNWPLIIKAGNLFLGFRLSGIVVFPQSFRLHFRHPQSFNNTLFTQCMVTDNRKRQR